VFVCPSNYGGKLWMASAYDPVAQALFLPVNNLCLDYKAVAQERWPARTTAAAASSSVTYPGATA